MAVLDTEYTFKLKGKTGADPILIAGSDLSVSPDDYDLVSAEIHFFVDTVEVSKFIFQEDNLVFMEERAAPISGVSLSSTQETVKDLNKWVGVVNTFTKLPLKPQSNFISEVEQELTTNDQIKHKFTSLGILLFDAIWHKTESELDFGSRVEAIVLWADFSRYVDEVNRLLFKEIPLAQ